MARYLKIREFLLVKYSSFIKGLPIILCVGFAEEFAAHAGNVNCASIGKKSSGVLVTGGDDKRVNLWTIGHQAKSLVRIKSSTMS